jgi:hypothetical protein
MRTSTDASLGTATSTMTARAAKVSAGATGHSSLSECRTSLWACSRKSVDITNAPGMSGSTGCAAISSATVLSHVTDSHRDADATFTNPVAKLPCNEKFDAPRRDGCKECARRPMTRVPHRKRKCPTACSLRVQLRDAHNRASGAQSAGESGLSVGAFRSSACFCSELPRSSVHSSSFSGACFPAMLVPGRL